MLDMNADLENLRGADYNPRFIEPEVLAKLQESIRTLGLIKPMIARGDLLVAGHQRTKALLAMGITKAPVFRLGANVTTYDEVRFNQLHNGTDMDAGDEEAQITVPLREGFQTIDAENMTANWRCSMANVRKAIMNLIMAYGPWGSVVATLSGKVIHCGQYAIAAHLTRTPLTVYGIPDDQEDLYRSYLDKTYGKFSYDNIQKHTYIQTYAQLHRQKDDNDENEAFRLFREFVSPTARFVSSMTQCTLVAPWLNNGKKDLRGIDLFSGQGEFADALRAAGWKKHIDVELFRRAKGRKDTFDTVAVQGMISTLCRSLRKHGLFDWLVCDSVLNSVDCLDAERAVMIMIGALVKPGGKVFFSGRSMGAADLDTATKSTGDAVPLSFLDDNGFTALYRNGHWFFQAFHDREGIERLAEIAKVKLDVVKMDSCWRVAGTKVGEHTEEEVRWACDYEFNLEIAKGRSLGRAEDVKAALAKAYGWS